MSSQDTPIVTGETTVWDLQVLLEHRCGRRISVAVGIDSDGDWGATAYGPDSHCLHHVTAGTLAEALSALLAEIPEVRRG